MAQAKSKPEEDNVTPISQASKPGDLQPDESYEPTYDLRHLHAGDTVRVYRWVRAAQAEDAIREAAERGGVGAAQYAVIDVLMGKVEDEFYPWLKSLAGIEGKADEELPADAPIALISDLVNHADFLGVFRSALRASQALKRISSLFATEPESQSDSESETENS